ncbi:photoreceptor outer segment membrane glycoprotein 2 isoform X1 [Plutella xylostella]|uniref:photoreceptor outer segment membrane glycoprotein 2 isoform X1 n=2 Tax=Plutella xylostella TaxID=51655 RepID=UPI002032A4AD|nr:photoreceptor outer segment membrane glycoprotein 2 isoform X1 [Plutella xylostella]
MHEINMTKPRNRAWLVWMICFLWLLSLLAVAWSLILCFTVGDFLVLTQTDIVNAFLLLSGLTMLPANIFMMYAVANGKKIDPNSRVGCCPLWFCNLCIVSVNAVGAILCIIRIRHCKTFVSNLITTSLKEYRNVPTLKRFMDNVQWAMKCCGANSYKDWFKYNWNDKAGGFDWDMVDIKLENLQADSVPLSCCKSGSCISNYLTELGTFSINTDGCADVVSTLIKYSMCANLLLFVAVICLQVMILYHMKECKSMSESVKTSIQSEEPPKGPQVTDLMLVNQKFAASSDSYQMYSDNNN